MRTVRLIAALAVAALLPFAAGCGGSDSPGGAAGVVPGDLAFYAVVDTDFDGDQWEAVRQLAARFPGGEDFLERLAEEAESDVDFERDVEPALGPELVVTVLEFAPDEGEPPVVVLTQPDDEEALRRLLDKVDEEVVTEEVDGWQALAADRETLDRFLQARNGPRLDDSESFESAMDGLEEDALALAYVDWEAVTSLEGSDEATSGLGLLAGGDALRSLSFSLRAEEDSGRLDGQAVFDGDVEDTLFGSEPFEAELPEAVPGGVLAYVGFNDLEGVISSFRDRLAELDPELERGLGQAEGFLGVSIEEDIAPLFAGEGALYVRPGALVPEVTLVTRVEDEGQAVATLDELVAGAALFFPFGTPQRSEVAGAEVRELPVAPPFSLFYTALDGLLVITTSREAIVALRSDDDRLADDEEFKDALEDAGVPDETTGFGWVNLADALPLVSGYAGIGLGDAPDDARRYTDPLRSLVFWSTEDDDTARFSVVLGVE